MARAWAVVGVGIGAAAVTTWAAAGPLAPWLVERLAQDRTVWRLGRLEISGVTGPDLGHLRAARLALRDRTGLWLEAEDVQLDWRPLRLIRGEIALEAVRAGEIRVLRRPDLAPSGGKGPLPDLTIKAELPRIALAAPVFGEAALARLDLDLHLADKALQRLRLEAAGLEANVDRLSATADRTADGVHVAAELLAPAGGPLARFLGAPAKAALTGGPSAWQARLTLAGAPAVAFDLTPVGAGWRATGTADLAAAPALAATARRLGGPLTLTAQGAGPGAAWTAELSTPLARLQAEGDQDAKTLTPVWPVRLAASAEGRALGLAGGTARFTGTLARGAQDWRLEGEAIADGMRAGGVSVSGPAALSARLDAAALNARIEAPGFTVRGGSTVQKLFDAAAGEVALRYDRAAGRAVIETFRLESQSLAAAGDADSGRWRLKALGAVLPGAGGAAEGRWRREGPSLEIKGRGEALSDLPPPLGALGRAPALEAQVRWDEGVTIDAAKVLGERLRLGARGRFAPAGPALDLEASWRGTLSAFGLAAEGPGEASARLAGRYAALSLKGAAAAQSLSLAGAPVEAAQAQFDLVPSPRGVAGEIALKGALFGLRASGEGKLTAGPKGAEIAGLFVQVGAATAAGDARFTKEGPTLRLALGGRIDGLWPGAAGPLAGEAAIDPGPDGDGVIAGRALVREAALAPGLPAGEAALRVDGPLAAPRLALAAKGAAGGWAPYEAQGEGAAAFDADGVSATIALRGVVNGQRFATEAPLAVRLAQTASLQAAVGFARGGRAAVQWREAREATSLAVSAENAPLALLGANGPGVTGTASGRLSLRRTGQALAGELAGKLAQVGLARRAGDKIDADIAVRLEDGRLAGEAEARSAGGLTAALAGAIPVEVDARALRIARARGADGRLRWSARGPVDGLWGLLGPIDQSLTGAIDGGGAITIGASGIAGDGALRFADGAFEDKTTGARLRDIQAELRLNQDQVTLERLSASDADGGRLRGAGALRLDGQGALDLSFDGFAFVDRPDLTARGGGDLKLAWTGEGATLSGAVRFDEVEARPPQASAAAPVVIPVIEINRPEQATRLPEAPSLRRGPVRLDLQVSAADRVFTRGRGLEAEWSLDARVRGPLEAPEAFGEARLLRGAFTLGGRNFTLESGLIRLDGPLEQAALDLRAEAASEALNAVILVTGPLTAPEVTLQSDPPLPQDEILPLVLFGRDAQDLSPVEAASLAASLASLTGRSAFDVAAAARAAVDLDRLDVRGGAGGVIVTGGKYLTRDVYLELERTAQGQAGTTVEWQLRPRLYVISSFRQDGAQRVAVRYRRDY